MKISANTKISQLLKADDDMVDFIVSIHPKFSKLANPFLRKAIAPRVTIKDAARIAGMPVEKLLEKLAEKGFEIDTEAASETAVAEEKCDKPPFKKVHIIRANEMLDAHTDPFDTIRKALLALQPGEAVDVVLDFIPVPLIDIFAKQGYAYCTEKKDGMYHTYFYKKPEPAGFWQKLKSLFGGSRHQAATERNEMTADEKEFDRLMEKYRNNLQKIDVRDLEMPQPMMKILETLKTLPEETALYVDHKRIPQFLLPELEKAGYRWATKRINPDYTQMIIYKPAGND